MGISLADATGLLLAGKKLSWDKYKDHKAGSINLDKPGQRRLLEFLLKTDSSKVGVGDESLFDGLVAAWENEQHEAWSTLIGKKQEDGTFPDNSVEAKLSVLEQALGHAKPLDDLSKQLSSAAKLATTCAEINKIQKTREAIKDALEPLKALQALVAAETASSIAALSGTINAICERISLRERLSYEEATIGRKEVGVTGSFSSGMRINAALVANTSWLYDEAKNTNDDAKAREYIRKVRIYCEGLIKFMLRGISRQIPDMTLNELKEELKKLGKAHVAPFDRKPFEALINAPNESQKAIQYINDPHHKDDESFGVAESDVVRDYWDKTLLDKIHTAFAVFDTFELYTGEPRTFPWAKNIIEFPDGHKARVKKSGMQQTGVAAAAKTDGRAGDGIVTVKEWEAGDKVVLPNHDVFQLAAGTLDPVASIGDLIIVSNYAKINPRNLVVAVSGSTLLARRLNRPENHSEIVVLTGQAVDPSTLPQPVIVPLDTAFRKIVGTLFTSHLLPVPCTDPEHEFITVPDPNILDKTMKWRPTLPGRRS
jgi:hypothetical protein